MRNQNLLFSLLFLLGLVSDFFSQNSTSYYKEVIDTLCSDYYHGRGYVKGGDSLASVYIANEFQKNGIKPLKKSYFQSFNFDVNTFPNKVELSNRSRNYIPGIHFLVNPASPDFKKQILPIELPVSTLLNQELLIPIIKDVLSKQVNGNAISIQTKGFSSDTILKLKQLAYSLTEVLPVILVEDGKMMWSVADEQMKFPLIEIQDSVYLPNEKWQVIIDAKIIHHKAFNVIGYLPAKSHPKKKKTLFITAHYDHLGMMGDKAMFPGANDNASGVAMLLSLANYLKANPIDLNIVFITFAGEEAGLLGSKYFTEHPLMKLSKVDFVLNLDIMGSGDVGVTVVNATELKTEFETLTKINEDHQYVGRLKPRGQIKNSDHYWFSMKNVPAFFIYTEGNNLNYHDVNDKSEFVLFEQEENLKMLFYDFLKSFENH